MVITNALILNSCICPVFEYISKNNKQLIGAYIPVVKPRYFG